MPLIVLSAIDEEHQPRVAARQLPAAIGEPIGAA
jgi:hypothetical protein